jgi:restriction endonuclease Mrr
VILIDGDRLANLMIEYCGAARISRTIEVKRLDEDVFLED